MIPFNQLTAHQTKDIQYILFDIDDTITNNGKVKPEAYNALWQLYNKGYYPIPVTGRPAGWCDLIIRQWPVKAIVGENGAFVFYYDNDQLCTFTNPSVDEESQSKLNSIKEEVLRTVHGSRLAKDQFCRKYDVAIDYNEDKPYLGLDAAERIRQICVLHGAEAKVSSIHVNTWFGQYDKLSTTLLFLKDKLKQNNPKDTVMFFGDSPNDEPMFEYFTYSCGVANILQFEETMTTLPTYVAPREGGDGFADAIAHFLSLK